MGYQRRLDEGGHIEGSAREEAVIAKSAVASQAWVEQELAN
jgi:hypothetical protein